MRLVVLLCCLVALASTCPLPYTVSVPGGSAAYSSRWTFTVAADGTIEFLLTWPINNGFSDIYTLDVLDSTGSSVYATASTDFTWKRDGGGAPASHEWTTATAGTYDLVIGRPSFFGFS